MRILIDPQTSKQQKQQAAMFLQQAQQGGQEEGMSTLNMLGTGASAIGGGLLGGMAGKALARSLGDGLGPVARGAQQMDTRRMLPEAMQNRFMDSVHPGELVGTGLGAGIGAGASYGLKTALDPYEDPLAAGM
jgi:hypothetical protein